mmetsp:Transcript_8084/g.25306  ORF Transcript_8084/g.25306 Transcript_8084/m.25306 type:complete len:412 (+) Transcript_8084:938-2173(+)
MVDHLHDGVQTLLQRERVRVVHRADVLRGLGGRIEVRRPDEPHGEGVEARHPLVAAAGRDFALERALGHRGHQRRVEAARQQHAPRHVGHHPALDRLLERFPEHAVVARRGRQHAVAPRRRVPQRVLLRVRLPAVARLELLDLAAVAGQRLHLRRDPHRPVLAPTQVERRDPDVVARGAVEPRALVVDDEGEHASQQRARLLQAELAIQRNEHLAVRARLGLVGEAAVLQELVELAVVVDLAVGRHDDGTLLDERGAVGPCAGRREERLRARLGVDDREALVRDRVARGAADAVLRDAEALERLGGGVGADAHERRGRLGVRRLADELVAGPVGPAVPHAARALDQLGTQLRLCGARRDIKDAEDAAHCWILALIQLVLLVMFGAPQHAAQHAAALEYNVASDRRRRINRS